MRNPFTTPGATPDDGPDVEFDAAWRAAVREDERAAERARAQPRGRSIIALGVECLPVEGSIAAREWIGKVLDGVAHVGVAADIHVELPEAPRDREWAIEVAVRRPGLAGLYTLAFRVFGKTFEEAHCRAMAEHAIMLGALREIEAAMAKGA